MVKKIGPRSTPLARAASGEHTAGQQGFTPGAFLRQANQFLDSLAFKRHIIITRFDQTATQWLKNRKILLPALEQSDLAGFEKIAAKIGRFEEREKIGENIKTLNDMLGRGLIQKPVIPILKIMVLKLAMEEPTRSNLPNCLGLLEGALSSGRLKSTDLPILLEMAEAHRRNDSHDLIPRTLSDSLSMILGADNLNSDLLLRINRFVQSRGVDFDLFMVDEPGHASVEAYNEDFLKAMEELKPSDFKISIGPQSPKAETIKQFFQHLGGELSLPVAKIWKRLQAVSNGDIFKLGQFEELASFLWNIDKLLDENEMAQIATSYEQIKGKGYFATTELLRMMYKDPEATLPGLQQIKEEILSGRFDPDNALHVSAAFIMLQEQISENPLLKVGLDYDGFKIMLQRYVSAGAETRKISLMPAKQHEVLYLAYEASLLKDFIARVLEKADQIGKKVLIVENRSYGTIALAPIREFLEQEMGIKVTSARIGSTECHFNAVYTRDDLFDPETVKFIEEEMPVVIVVDGSSSVSNNLRTSPHIPDSYIGYRNYLSRYSYFMEFWYPGQKHLYLREWKVPSRKVVSIDPEQIEGPVVIFAQSVIEPEAIPPEIREKIGREHEGAFFDDRPEFVESAYDLTPYGPAFSSVYLEAAKQAYQYLILGKEITLPEKQETASLKDLGLTNSEIERTIDKMCQLIKLLDLRAPEFIIANEIVILFKILGIDYELSIGAIVDGIEAENGNSKNYLKKLLIERAGIDLTNLAEFPEFIRRSLS